MFIYLFVLEENGFTSDERTSKHIANDKGSRKIFFKLPMEAVCLYLYSASHFQYRTCEWAGDSH